MTIKHYEIKTYFSREIAVRVAIDYDLETISLIEMVPNGPVKPKNWVFSGRNVEYMESWQNILDAMKYAIAESTKSLKEDKLNKQKQKNEEVTEVLIQASKIVKSRRGGHSIK